MTKQEIIRIAEDLMKENTVAELSCAVAAQLGISDCSFFDAPLIGVAAADDVLFEDMKQPHAIGPHFITPNQWLDGAKSVVSIFVPYSQMVKKANSSCPADKVAAEYVYAKNVAVPYIDALVEKLIGAIKTEGYSVVVPSKESARMKMETVLPDGTKLYTSRWSERHIAYICGLGSFGISGGLITSKGPAGRFISFVTDMPLEADTRAYTDVYEYCTFCGGCAARCPADAITMEGGKVKAKCSVFVDSTKEQYKPLYGCAKCQCGVACANGIPKKR